MILTLIITGMAIGCALIGLTVFAVLHQDAK
jgi:hypothetical protein